MTGVQTCALPIWGGTSGVTVASLDIVLGTVITRAGTDESVFPSLVAGVGPSDDALCMC